MANQSVRLIAVPNTLLMYVCVLADLLQDTQSKSERPHPANLEMRCFCFSYGWTKRRSIEEGARAGAHAPPKVAETAKTLFSEPPPGHCARPAVSDATADTGTTVEDSPGYLTPNPQNNGGPPVVSSPGDAETSQVGAQREKKSRGGHAFTPCSLLRRHSAHHNRIMIQAWLED